MKVKFAVQRAQEEEKDGMFSKKKIDMYTLTATFSPSELEKKIYNDHPLFKEMLFMEYSELDKWTTGLIFKDKVTSDNKKTISVAKIYGSPTYTFRAYSVPRILELRELVVEAGRNFATTVAVLAKLEGSDELEFQPND